VEFLGQKLSQLSEACFHERLLSVSLVLRIFCRLVVLYKHAFCVCFLFAGPCVIDRNYSPEAGLAVV
jgi:hypothetical protein